MTASVQQSIPNDELQQLFEEFSKATAGLQAAHDALLEQVNSLQEELDSKNRRLERKKRLEALGRVAAGVAHEFRNPLGGIRLTVDALIAAEPEERAGRRLEHIRRATHHLDRIVQDLLIFTRADALEKSSTSVADLIELVMETAFPGGCDRELRCSGDGQLLIDVDCHAFTGVLVNLLVNARQAIGEGPGSLGICWGLCEDGSRVWFEVADQGPGIPVGDEEQIFHPFHSQREGGTGLGLAIVHDRVEAHEGEIAVVHDAWGEWPEWSGARLRIVLPTQKNAEVV